MTYEPPYIPLLLVFLGIAYFFFFSIIIYKFKLDLLTVSILALSFLTYLLVGVYMTGKGYYLDGHAPDNLIFRRIGFMELILVLVPYVFLSLTAGIGEKKKR